MNINVAVSIDLMTSLEGSGLGGIDVSAIKHICLVGNNGSGVQETKAIARAKDSIMKTESTRSGSVTSLKTAGARFRFLKIGNNGEC
jgi:hypothetical protein